MAMIEPPHPHPVEDDREHSVAEWLDDALGSGRMELLPNGEGADDVLACPYCNSEFASEKLAPGLFETTVYHDDSCPWLVQHQAELA